jgi:hypothetical protein
MVLLPFVSFLCDFGESFARQTRQLFGEFGAIQIFINVYTGFRRIVLLLYIYIKKNNRQLILIS